MRIVHVLDGGQSVGRLGKILILLNYTCISFLRKKCALGVNVRIIHVSGGVYGGGTDPLEGDYKI